MIDRVNVFVAGAQKSGTTALFTYLREHPQLITSEVKELHYFDDEALDWQRTDHTSYHSNFPVCTDGQGERLAIDVTPIYSFWPGAMTRIRAYNPSARIILIHRDPIERAYSHWNMERSRGDENLPFSEAIRQGRERLTGLEPADDRWRIFSYVERGFYARQLENVLSLFPKTQVLTLTSGLLSKNPSGTLGKISDFLGIGRFPDTAPRREHVGRSDWPPATRDDVSFLRSIFEQDTRHFAALTGLPVKDWPTLNV